MFKKIAIKGYRGITELSISDFKKVNLLVGRNNCGKTTVLEALFCISNPANAQLPVITNNLRQLLITKGWAVFFYNLNTHNPIRISAELISPREIRDLTVTSHRQSRVVQALKFPQQGSVAEQMKGNFSGTEMAIIGLDYDFDVTEPGQNKASKKFQSQIFFSDKLVPGQNPTGAPIQVPILVPHPPQNYSETLKAQMLTPSILGNLATNFDAAQREKRVEKIVKVLQRIEPLLKTLVLGSDSLIYADIGFQTLVPVNIMGDGIVRLLAIVLAISFCRDGVLLIDEIETGFHYSSLAVLWQAVFEASRDFNTQIIATTHSWECVSTFSKSSEEDTRLFRLEKVDDQFKAIAFDKTTLSTARDSEWEVR